MTMKPILVSLVAALAALSLHAAELEWHTDLVKAQAKAKAEKKQVLVNFTGSDWCGFCIKLQKEVFTTDEFKEFAGKNLVLVELDFPRKKELPADLKAANKKLQDQYQVKGFPTLLLLDGDGKKVGQMVGYGGGGTKAVLEKVGATKG
jgi:protein disulfide-isomerase